jgi:hypothetical protein
MTDTVVPQSANGNHPRPLRATDKCTAVWDAFFEPLLGEEGRDQHIEQVVRNIRAERDEGGPAEQIHDLLMEADELTVHAIYYLVAGIIEWQPEVAN